MNANLPSTLVTSAAGLTDLVKHVRERGRFGFDTEFVSEDTFEPDLCLIQIATDKKLAIVDPLAPGIGDLKPFWDLLLDPSVEVIMHAAGEDLRIGKMRTGKVPSRIFDVQLAAGLAGYSYPLSLTNLVGQLLGVTLAGSETRTDWRRRPLTSAQMNYALEDVRHLLEMADRLKTRLTEMGRMSWCDGELAHFLSGIDNQGHEERWRRLPGLQNLNRRGLEIARRLADWRIEEARQSNRPLRHLIRDDLLVAIAKRAPASRMDLEALRDFNRPHLVKRSAEVLKVIEDAKKIPETQLPEPSERPDDGPGLSMLVNLLNAALSFCSARRRVAISLLGTPSDIRDLVRWQIGGRPKNHVPILMRGWRAEVCGQELLDVLEGRVGLKVGDPESDVPVELAPIRPASSDDNAVKTASESKSETTS